MIAKTLIRKRIRHSNWNLPGKPTSRWHGRNHAKPLADLPRVRCKENLSFRRCAFVHLHAPSLYPCRKGIRHSATTSYTLLASCKAYQRPSRWERHTYRTIRGRNDQDAQWALKSILIPSRSCRSICMSLPSGRPPFLFANVVL
jgi:hypothetical protein